MCCTLLYTLYIAQFINSPVDGHLKYFPFFTTRNNAALNIFFHYYVLLITILLWIFLSMAPYERVSLGCKCHTVGYDIPNYTAQVFYEFALLKASVSIHLPTVSHALGIVRFKHFCQSDGGDMVLGIHAMAVWCWAAKQRGCLDCSSRKNLPKGAARQLPLPQWFKMGDSAFHPQPHSSQGGPSQLLSTAVMLGPGHLYSRWTHLTSNFGSGAPY